MKKKDKLMTDLGKKKHDKDTRKHGGTVLQKTMQGETEYKHASCLMWRKLPYDVHAFLHRALLSSRSSVCVNMDDSARVVFKARNFPFTAKSLIRVLAKTSSRNINQGF